MPRGLFFLLVLLSWAFGALIRSDYRRWEPVVKASGAKLDD